MFFWLRKVFDCNQTGIYQILRLEYEYSENENKVMGFNLEIEMDQEQIRITIAKLLADSVPLSDIQDILKNEHQVNMTFLELRLLASELDDIDWSKLNKGGDDKEEKPEAGDQMTEEPVEPETMEAEPVLEEEASSGNTVVEMNKIARPGAVASGTVKFASGVTAEWILDQFGRLGLDKPSGQPTPEDLQKFQAEIQKVLSGGGM